MQAVVALHHVALFGLAGILVEKFCVVANQQIINTLTIKFPELILDTPLITQMPAKKLQIQTLEAILRSPSEIILTLSKNIPHLLQYDGSGKFLVGLPEIENITFEYTAFKQTGRMDEKYYTRFFELLTKLRTKYDTGQSEMIDAHIERMMYQAHTKNGQLRKKIAQYLKSFQ